MKYKKALAALITISITGMNFLPLPAIAKDKKDKVLKSQVSQYQIDYINMPWWESFGDENLNSYIAQAIENNHDLKVATLRVEQYRQLEKLKLAAELPTVYGGFAPKGVKLPGSTSTRGTWAVHI